MDLQGKHIGNYVAKAELGSGGMGVVYLCEHPLIRRRVAAKVLHEELAASEEIVRRLFAEAKAANEIDSEHIIEVLDFGRMEDGGRELVYLIMEFLEGEGLGERLWRTGLTIEESLHIVRQCCEALQASHEAGIIHRDLKPENVFLLERRGDPNFVKILDFGIAKVSGNPSTKTRTGVLLGTPAYMSPEQCRGSGAVDARSDVYSLGIVLYELTTGDVPFNGQGYGQVLLAQMTEKPKPPTQLNKDLPKVVEDIVLRAMEKDPDKRFQSMADFASAIAAAEEALGVRPPVAQIPRKGLHNRETFVRNGRKRGTVEGALAEVAKHAGTPMDPALHVRMAAVAADAPTQMMEAVAEPVAPDVKEGPAATVINQRLPTHIMKAAQEAALEEKLGSVPSLPHSTPATEMSRDGAGNLTTGPRGMLAPVIPKPVSSSSPQVPTVLTSQAPTAVRATASSDEQHSATAEIDERAIFPNTGRRVAIVFVVIAAIAAAVAFFLHGRA